MKCCAGKESISWVYRGFMDMRKSDRYRGDQLHKKSKMPAEELCESHKIKNVSLYSLTTF
jgi:hypothetical protein